MESERVCGVVLALRRLIPHCHLYPGIGDPYMGMTHAGSVTLHFVNSIEHKRFEGAL